MPNKHLGRPGLGRAAGGRIRASIRPDLKQEAETIATTDNRIRSLSHLIESAVALYVLMYRENGGQLDRDGIPLIRPPTAHPAGGKAAIYQRKPGSG